MFRASPSAPASPFDSESQEDASSSVESSNNAAVNSNGRNDVSAESSLNIIHPWQRPVLTAEAPDPVVTAAVMERIAAGHSDARGSRGSAEMAQSSSHSYLCPYRPVSPFLTDDVQFNFNDFSDVSLPSASAEASSNSSLWHTAPRRTTVRNDGDLRSGEALTRRPLSSHGRRNVREHPSLYTIAPSQQLAHQSSSVTGSDDNEDLLIASIIADMERDREQANNPPPNVNPFVMRPRPSVIQMAAASSPYGPGGRISRAEIRGRDSMPVGDSSSSRPRQFARRTGGPPSGQFRVDAGPRSTSENGFLVRRIQNVADGVHRQHHSVPDNFGGSVAQRNPGSNNPAERSGQTGLYSVPADNTYMSTMHSLPVWFASDSDMFRPRSDAFLAQPPVGWRDTQAASAQNSSATSSLLGHAAPAPPRLGEIASFDSVFDFGSGPRSPAQSSSDDLPATSQLPRSSPMLHPTMRGPSISQDASLFASESMENDRLPFGVGRIPFHHRHLPTSQLRSRVMNDRFGPTEGLRAADSNETPERRHALREAMHQRLRELRRARMETTPLLSAANGQPQNSAANTSQTQGNEASSRDNGSDVWNPLRNPSSGMRTNPRSSDQPTRLLQRTVSHRNLQPPAERPTVTIDGERVPIDVAFPVRYDSSPTTYRDHLRRLHDFDAERRRRLVYVPHTRPGLAGLNAGNWLQFMEGANAIFMNSDGEPKLILEDDVIAAIAADTESFVFEDQFLATDECIICFEEYETGQEVRVLSCNSTHRFHKGCIDKWLVKNKPNCPICRSILPSLKLPRDHINPSSSSARNGTLSDALSAANVAGGAGPSQQEAVPRRSMQMPPVNVVDLFL